MAPHSTCSGGVQVSSSPEMPVSFGGVWWLGSHCMDPIPAWGGRISTVIPSVWQTPLKPLPSLSCSVTFSLISVLVLISDLPMSLDGQPSTKIQCPDSPCSNLEKVGMVLWDSPRVGNLGEDSLALTGTFHPSGSFCCVSSGGGSPCS